MEVQVPHLSSVGLGNEQVADGALGRDRVLLCGDGVDERRGVEPEFGRDCDDGLRGAERAEEPGRDDILDDGDRPSVDEPVGGGDGDYGV